MKNILNIARYDLKKITGSVVAIVTIMGLCLVPCSYAWFNILSNWSPYESEATGRISVAVANADEGAQVAGVTINVGEKIVEALKANDDIGWAFVDSDLEAKRGVRSGKYYAALVVPEGFSNDVLSFANGDLTNPTLVYYENEKKNAIAPKITSKAEAAVRKEVNASFVETLAAYVSDAASAAKATGTDPAGVLSDLSSRIEALSGDVNSCIVLADSAAGLTSSAEELLGASDVLLDSTRDVLSANEKVLAETEKELSKRQTASRRSIGNARSSVRTTSSSLESLDRAVSALSVLTPDEFNRFLQGERDQWIARVNKMQADAYKQAKAVDAEGFTALASEFTQLGDKLGDISADLSVLNTDMTLAERSEALKKLRTDIAGAITLAKTIENQIKSDIDNDISTALRNTSTSIAGFRKTMSTANKDLGKLSKSLSSYQGSLAGLQSSLKNTSNDLRSVQSGADTIAHALSNASGNELLTAIKKLMGGDESSVAEYLANPVRMDSEVIWPIENYGSAMPPFYTVLAQWVGALLTAVLIKVRVKRRESLNDLKLHESFFGRYGLYLLIGIAQALIVSFGDLLYVRIQCEHPLLFVLAACVNGMVFMMVNYALVFALDNIGMGAAVIILVLQVAGSGGTYPVEVLPAPFRVLFPFMPFRYAMDAMRECIGGLYNGTYWKCLGILMIFFIISIVFGLALYYPAKKLNELIAESKAKSEIML